MTMKAINMQTEADWRAEEDLRVLMRAKEITRDKKRMEAVRKLAQEQLQSLAKVAGDDD